MFNRIFSKVRTLSPWVLHFDCGSCNGCDIEVLACLTPVYDVERFGMINVGNPMHADVFLVTGTVNHRNKKVLRNLYDQIPDPKVVVAIGACGLTGGIFRETYNVVGGVDKVIPVDVYVPGCPAKPEAIIDGVVLSLEKFKAKARIAESAHANGPVEEKP
jgi:ech hydrogenase subunit C